MRGIIFETFNSIRTSFTGPMLRNIGKRIYEAGTQIQGSNASEDVLVPSLRKLTYAEK